jgi:hypothetical protein
MELGISQLIGPLMAESLEDNKDILDAYVKSSKGTDIKTDKYISAIIRDNRIVLSGVRGTGKTMILKVANELLKQELDYNMHYVNEWEADKAKKKVLPVYITYSGFKEEVSLQNDLSMTEADLTSAREVFRSYFFITLLQSILNVIEDLQLDNDVEFNFFGLRTKFGIKRDVDKAINDMKRKGFREIVEAKNSGADAGIKISLIDLTLNKGTSKQTKEIILDDMQKVYLFKDTIDSLCKTYGFDSIMFLFDEVHYLKYLQPEFFNALFGFRNFQRIGYAISTYPTFMNYGDNFDVPDDAKEVTVTNNLFKPSKDDYNRQFIELVEKRIKKYAEKNYEVIISKDALEFLITLVYGNPRILLQAIDHIWRRNNEKKIIISSITQNIIEEMSSSWYIDYFNNQANRYRTSIEKANMFLKVIIDRFKEYNGRNENATIFFLLSDEICIKYSETIDLLIYSRLINKARLASFGGTYGQKGILYALTPMIAWYYGIFNKKQINNLIEGIKYSIDKDLKIQFKNSSIFDSEIKSKSNIACPRVADKTCPNQDCKGSYSEKWKRCPYNELSLEIEHLTSKEVDIEVLGISSRLKARLNEANIKTLHDIIVAGKEGLMKIQYIKQVRASGIYDLAKEYIDDNL